MKADSPKATKKRGGILDSRKIDIECNVTNKCIYKRIAKMVNSAAVALNVSSSELIATALTLLNCDADGKT